MATGVAIAASVLQVIFCWFKYRKVETIHIVSLLIIIVLGGATLLLHNDIFIKWKPTVISWTFALVYLLSQFIGTKSLSQRMLDSNIELPPYVWRQLNLSWVIFFVIIGSANLYVAYHYDQNTWVNFKLFGLMGLTILFVLIQAFYMSKFINIDQDDKELSK